MLVADGQGEGTASPDLQALRALVGLLAKAIVRDNGPVRALVVDEDWAPVAALAGAGTEDVAPWRSYLEIEPDLGHADWRDEVMAMTTPVETVR